MSLCEDVYHEPPLTCQEDIWVMGGVWTQHVSGGGGQAPAASVQTQMQHGSRASVLGSLTLIRN